MNEMKKITSMAQAVLREANRPVSRDDMMWAMNKTVQERMDTFQQAQDVPNAVMLLATIFCRNILRDGPLHKD